MPGLSTDPRSFEYMVLKNLMSADSKAFVSPTILVGKTCSYVRQLGESLLQGNLWKLDRETCSLAPSQPEKNAVQSKREWGFVPKFQSK